MDLTEALRFATEWYPTDPDADEALSVLAAEVERLREVTSADGARIFRLQVEVEHLRAVEQRLKDAALNGHGLRGQWAAEMIAIRREHPT